MISLTNNIPLGNTANAEWIRIYNLYKNYPQEALFWQQQEKAYISLIDGNMTVYNLNADIEELRQFIDVVSPSSIFTDAKTMSDLGYDDAPQLCVLARKGTDTAAEVGDSFNSKPVYEIFEKSGLDLPEYQYFAPDFCKRINKGNAGCFYKRDRSAAFYIISGDFALIQGIASLKKGEGTEALQSVLSGNKDRTVVVCCKSEVEGFYIKNGFERIYNAAFKERE